jgi:Transglycosylase SLT domain
MNGWQLSCVFSAMTAIMLAAFWHVVGAPPAVRASAIVEANLTAGPTDTTVIAKSTARVAPDATSIILKSIARAGPPNTTVIVKSAAEISPVAMIDAAFSAVVASAQASTEVTGTDVTGTVPRRQVLAYAQDNAAAVPGQGETDLQDDRAALDVDSATEDEHDLPYFKYAVYSALPASIKPAKLALESMSHIPLGTPQQEIKRAANAFGMDYAFLKAVAKIESDFDPKERTGSYIGLFQLSRAEFKKYGSGDITNPRDNAVAAADKLLNEAALFEAATHKKPTLADLYLIHQQGWQGAAEHISHPDQLAWKSMCATSEGKEKGERWCKRAIWENTLPAIKRAVKSVDRLTSGQFIAMWRDRLNSLYARYAQASSQQQQAER